VFTNLQQMSLLSVTIYFKTAGFGSEVIFRQVRITTATVAAPVLGCATCSQHIVKLGAIQSHIYNLWSQII